MKFTWDSYKKPIIALAPMANITTLPFRSICKEMGANVVYTPMLSSNAITHNTEKTLKVAEFLPEEQPVIVQIFGYSGELIAKAANIVDKKLKPAGIDINMGCPAPKITGNECGSALLRDLDKALEITKEVREKYDGQLSVKLRLGWNGFDILDFVKKLEEIGIDSVSIHGRTTKQGYRGEANWEAIEEIAGAVGIPVIGNGDITTWQEAETRLKDSKLAGIMIGRATLGNPWLFKEITEKRDIEVDKKELTRVITLQTERYIDYIGEGIAMREMRKHLGWYLKGFSGASELRKQATQVNTYNDVKNVLKSLNSLEIKGNLR